MNHKPNQITPEHSLFERGTDFIEKSIDSLLPNDRTFDEVAYAVLYFWTGTELLLKQALMREHWSLIFGQVESANQEALKSGTFISVDFNTAIKRLRNICGVKINEDEYKFLDSVYAQRNKLMHYGKLDSHDSVISLIAKALDFLCNKFCHEALPNEDSSRIKELAHELEEYIETVWDRIRPDIENAREAGNFIFSCPSCHQPAGLVKEGTLKCLFCRAETDDNGRIYDENWRNPPEPFGYVDSLDGCCGDLVLRLAEMDRKGIWDYELSVCCVCGKKVPDKYDFEEE